jgi:hypothetical protein
MSTSTQVGSLVRPINLDLATKLVVAIGALVVGVVATRHGLRMWSDSAVYLGTAHNLLHGHGTTSPIALTYTDAFRPDAAVAFNGALPLTTFPPLYPVMLATIGAFGVSLMTAARVVGVACLVAAALLVTHLTLRLTGSRVVALATALLFILGGAIGQGVFGLPGSWIILGSSVLSEAPFLVIVLGTISVLGVLLERGERRHLWSAAVLVALAVLCRYLGVALVGTAVILVLTRFGWPLATRIRRAVLIGAVGGLPTLLWLVSMRVFVGQGDPLPNKFHPLSGSDLHDGLMTVVRWFVPTSVPDAWALTIVSVAAGAIVVAGALTWWSRRSGRATTADERAETLTAADATVRAMLVFIAVYLLAVLASHFYLARNISFDARFLAVVRPLVYVLLATAAYRALRRVDALAATAGGAVAAGCVLLSAWFVAPVGTLLHNGVALPENSSPTVAAVKHLPPRALIFTDAVETLWGVDGRSAVLMPVRWVNESDSFNPHVASDVRQVADLLRRPNSYVVHFNEVFPGTFAPLSDLQRVAPLEVVATFRDGTIYRRAPGPLPSSS